MQLLLEEFFRKIFKVSGEKSPFTLKIIVKLTMYFIVIFGVFLILYLILTKNYLVITFILGLIIIGECAHFVRKFREKKIIKKITEKNKENKIMESKQVKELIKGKKVKNKRLLKINKSKNNNLLNITKSKNKNMLDEKKIKAVKVTK